MSPLVLETHSERRVIARPPAKPLKTSRIQVLAMRRNHLSGASGPALADILTANNTLRRLDLRQNELRVRPPRPAQPAHMRSAHVLMFV